MSRTIAIPHPVEIPLEKAVLDKLIQNCLIQPRNRAGEKPCPFMKDCQQVLWQNQITDADRRGNRLGKCSQVNHMSSLIHGLKRRNRPPPVLEFRIVIILDQIPVLSRRSPGEKLCSSRIRHHCSGRKLPRRHEIGKTAAGPFQRIRTHSSGIAPDRLHGKSHSLHHLRRTKIRRRLHADPQIVPHRQAAILPGFPQLFLCLNALFFLSVRRRAAISTIRSEGAGSLIFFRGSSSQKNTEQHHQIIVSCSDDDLFRIAMAPPREMQIVRNGGPKLRIALRVAPAKQICAVSRQNSAQNPPPGRIGKHGHIDRAGGKVNGRILLRFFL